jgi:xylitol oxidase
MPDAAPPPLPDPAPDGPLKNWAGNFTYRSSHLHQAASVEEAQTLVKKVDRLKVLGTRHCFNNIADSKDHFLSLSQLNKIIIVDPTRQTVTIEAGVRYGELATWLNDRGYALHNLASLPHISVAGGCATATHGSGVHNGNLSSAVTAMEFITASGELKTFSRDKDPQQFPGAVIHLGGLGVVTGMTLSIQPAYQVRQYVYENLPFSQLEHHFEEIMSAAYSVSLFTDWQNKNINEVWIKSRVGEGTDSRQQGDRRAKTDLLPKADLWKTDFFGARAATQNLHPIKDISPENCTQQMGIPGPWQERLPHFRMGFTPSSGTELQSEYFVPREHSYPALQAVARLQEKIAPHLLISEIRCIAADDLWMSPCYRQDCTAIHFTWQQDWPAVRQLLPLIEQQLAPFHAKPHWGKLFTVPYSAGHGGIAGLYKRLPDFRQLLSENDPAGKFRNEYLDKVIFEG